MPRPIIALCLFSTVLLGQDPARDALNQGVQAYKAAKYADAITAFEKALSYDPANPNARLYLATVYLTRWVPGLDTPENQDFAQRAESEFQRVLESNPNSPIALRSLASLTFNQKRLLDARSWNLRILAVDPADKEAYYSLGVIDWSRFYPEYSAARQQTGMRPQDPGPIKDDAVRQDLRNRLAPLLDDGMTNLSKALEIDPADDNAMAYLNLLYRERGDLRDNPQDCAADVAVADQWVAKALETRRAKASSGASGSIPPPPPPPGSIQRIRVGGNVQAANIIQKVTPVYPAEAKAARIQGTVRYQVIIGKDGHIIDMQLVTGHPLLVPASTEAVRQWVYKPTFLNGEPVEVITQIDVNFTLTQ